jgi:SAM-dependent methyltransferase
MSVTAHAAEHVHTAKSDRPAVTPAARRRLARERLVRNATACWSTQALGVAVEMDLPDRLAAGPASAESLAADCGAPTQALQRLLRALCSLEVCREGRDGRFTLAAGGEALRREATAGGPSLRAIVQWWAGPLWSLWPELGYSVRTGRSARERTIGQPGYAFLDAQPEMAAVFHESMQAMTTLIVDDIVALDLWREVLHVVDVGGGNGTLAAAIALAHPHLNAWVLDRADAEVTASELMRSKGVASRCRFVEGDFFVEVPAERDVYLLKSILHNWDDAGCARILSSCARAAAPGARLLLVERVRPQRLQPRHHDVALARTDLNMLAGLGGRERTREEYSALLASAGFELHCVQSTGFEFSVLEARRKRPS